ncbi:hypothetical protein ILUMI_08303 [Ignelater luminosus]|uniref:Rab-GAP TBC domain-containing protein n=1 Tax=Ignelater luminosus TaxID=2038154 RepID=A0A8K0D6C4_IGNLU|nr:hypothetical protein ILUMI_08303 [Ignelater luminosus]
MLNFTERPYTSTSTTIVDFAVDSFLEYEEITRRRLELTGSQLNHFRRKVQSVVEKDVVRTDRGNPFFAGDDNPNLDIMKNILLNYAVYNPGLGYTQGMSDLLAPVLCELRDEVAAFWCFVGLMQRAVFVATPTDRDMDRSLKYLRELVRIMVPHFYEHLEKHRDAAELLFCHRWILLCFKREFTEAVALRMWESCWANYLTDYFHLFLCLAIICVYADDVIAQDLRADEMLLHFSSLGKIQSIVIEMKRLKLDILGISDVRWPGSKQYATNNGTVYYSGTKDPKYLYGVAIIIKKKIKQAKEQYMEDRCKEIEAFQAIHDTFNLHKRVKGLTGLSKRRKCGLLRDRDAMYMDGQVIARKARGLLHQFRQLREIPCTLSGLCMRCGPGIWDSSHSPRVYCIGHEHGYCPNIIN